MPLDEYKRMLAGVILEGKKPKVPPQHKNAIKISLNNAEYEKLYATLRNLGFKKEEAIDKVEIAIQDGFIHETEIIKHILSLK
jgi:Holliday junction resolvasome RuvABC DNA-binding subunit